MGENKVRRCLNCGQVRTLRYEDRAWLQETAKTRSTGLVKGSHTEVCFQIKQRRAEALVKR